MNPARPIDGGLFTWPGAARLLAGSCATCGPTMFSTPASSPRGTGSDISTEALPPCGRLRTRTVPGFEPRSPSRPDGAFEPYGFGDVEVDGQFR